MIGADIANRYLNRFLLIRKVDGNMNDIFFEDFCVWNISVISGIRPSGRMFDKTCGRKNSGILYVFDGEVSFRDARARQVAGRTGALIFIPENERYKMEYIEKTTFVLVNFNLADKEGRRISVFDGITLIASEDEDYKFANIMAEFEMCGGSKSIGALMKKKELIYSLFAQVFSSHGYLERRKERSRISDGVRLLEQSYLEPLPIETFAEASHVSITTFRACFRKQFGISPVKYRNRLRIERAKELLLNGDFTVAEVAYACGFENIGYFCRYYKQIVGESPSEIKRRNQSADISSL